MIKSGWSLLARTPAKLRMESRKEVEARYVVNAAGVEADKVHAMVGGDTFHTLPNRGESPGHKVPAPFSSRPR